MKIGTPFDLCNVPMPLTLVPVYSWSCTLTQVTQPVSKLLISTGSRPGGNLGPELFSGPVGFGATGFEMNFGAMPFQRASLSRHSRASCSALALASALAHLRGPFFLPVVLSYGPSRCIVT